MKNERKKDLTYSTYAVTLYFDDEASVTINNLTASLAQIINNDYMLANKVPAHLTLGMFHVEDSDLQKLNFETFAKLVILNFTQENKES